jgi:hypothetical protein
LHTGHFRGLKICTRTKTTKEQKQERTNTGDLNLKSASISLYYSQSPFPWLIPTITAAPVRVSDSQGGM